MTRGYNEKTATFELRDQMDSHQNKLKDQLEWPWVLANHNGTTEASPQKKQLAIDPSVNYPLGI
jgi:hypothetical protein